MPSLEQVEAYLADSTARFEAELFELLRIPSVSAASQHKPDVQRAASWVAGQLTALGLASEIIETAGHPLVYAESPKVPGAPTVLVYGHYDVQPPEPLNEWHSPPFEPTVRNGNVYARGATDDKGQMFTHLKSAEAWLKTQGKLPLQLKFLIEGEEEIGSRNLSKYLATAASKLACDCVVISDTSQFAAGRPAITYGLRGIAYYELRLRGPKQDLHSGTFGGSVMNPAMALARMLTALIDGNGRIQIPGFYDSVRALTPTEKKQIEALEFSDAEFAQQLGVSALHGEAGHSTLERRWARPTCDVNGLWSGYQGEGAKTVLPATAGAKFSFRLVPDQDPQELSRSLEAFLRKQLPPGIEMELIDFHGAPGFVVSLDSPFIEAAAKAIERGFGRRPVFIREGGSIPIVTEFSRALKADVLLLGWGLDDDNTHSPNEKFCLADFHRGIRASAALWAALGSR